MANTKSEYKGPAAEYNERKKKQSLYKGPAYEYKANRFNKEREELVSRINAWAEDNNRLADSYKHRFEGREAGKYVSDSGEWLRILEEQGAKSDAEAASIRERLDYYKDFIGADWSKSVLDQLDRGSKFRTDVFDEATADHEYWSQWATEEDYNKAYAEYEDYQAKLNYDLEGAQAEIDRLRGEISSHWESIQPGIEKTKEYIAALEEENKKLSIYAAKGHKESANKVAENKKKIENAYAAIKEAQGQNDALKSTLSEKERYYTLAKRIQDGARLAAVSDPESEYYDPEFDKYTGYVSTNPGGIFGKLQEDITYEYINGDDETRAKLENKYQQYLLENHIEKGYGQLKPEEKAIYNYYYQKHGKEAAEEYLFSIADTLNARQAGVIFENVNDHAALEYLFGVYAGLDQFETGIENMLKNDDYIPTNSTQLASGMVREDLKDNGFTLPEWLGGASIGQVGYDVINTTSNMLPSILASAGANMILPGSGAYVGSALLGASAAGNAKAEMLNLGYSKEQANAYGLMVGASEAVLEKVLGGIPGLKGGDGIFSALGQKALGKIDNALARVAITIGGNMLDEGLEEGIQTIIEPWLAEIATKVDWEDPTIDEVLYSSLLGALSSIGFTGAGMVSSSVASNQNASKLFGDYAPELISRALEVGDPKVKALAESYQKKLDAGKKLSGSELNKLAQAVTGSASASTSTDSNARADGTENDPLEALALKVRLERVSRKDSSTTENPAEKKNAVRTEFEASADGKTIYHSERGDVETSVKEIASIENGTVKLIIDGGEVVDATELSFASEDEAMLYGMVADMGVDAQTANALIKGFDASDGVSARDYAINIPMAYALGKINNIAGLKSLNLPDTQAEFAFALGREAEKAKARARAEQLATANGSETGENVSETKGENTSEENVVYSSKKAKAVDAVPINKYDGNQKHVALVGLQIGRKVVYARTMNEKGVEVDGFLGTDGVIYINPNNPNPLAFVFKHELAHFCERAGQEYRDFVNTVRFSETFKNWLRGKGFESELEYNSQIRRERAEIGQTLDEESATREIMANFVGDVLFGDNTELAERIISELEPKPRKTFVDYIRDFISRLKRKLQGNSSRARNEIQKLESKFASAYQAALKSGANTRESFSISQSLESELDKLLKGTFDASRNEIYLGETSNFMTDVIGAQALSLYMPASKAYSALVTEEEYNKKPYYSKQDNYHGIGKADFIEILEKSETPIAAFAASADEKGNKRQNRIILVTDKLIRDAQTGKTGYAVVVEEVDSVARRSGKQIKANKAITVYPRLQLANDIQLAIAQGRILNITKKGEHLLAGRRGSNPQATIRKDVLKKNIAHFWENVKWESEKNKTYSSTETPTPTPMQAAFMKAGYIDQDGHNKYMQESENLSQENGDEQFSYTPVDPAEWLERYEKGEISREEYLEGMNKKPAKENPATIASLTPEDMKTTPKLAKKTGEAQGKGESRFHGSLQRSSIFDEKFKEEAKKDNFIEHYSAITNEDTLKEAAKLLDDGGEAYVEAWKNKRTVEMSTVDTVVGFILLKRYQDVGNYEGAMAVAQKIREVGTISGQRVQAFSIIGRYDADMMQAYAQKELAEALEKAVIGKSEKWAAAHKAQFELTSEEIAFIRDNILYAAKLPEGSREKAIALAQITTLIQDKIPPVKGQSYKAWQRVSMLLNPKTQIRNILGNAVMVPVFVASDWFSAPLDMALSRVTGVRTTGFTGTRGNRENLKAMGRGLFESYDDWKRHINTRQHDLNRFEIGQGKSFDETKWGRIAKMMNSADRFTSFLLDAGDRTFYEMWFTNSLNEQMRLNKVTEPTEAMVQTAIDEALERTWQDDNFMTKMVGKLKQAFNHINLKNIGQLTKSKESREFVESGYGLGDVLVKFTKTPANLTKAIYEFSPAAIATLLPQAVTLTRAIIKGKVTPAMQKRFVSNFGKMASGTMLYVIFSALYNAGRLTGKSDEDDDVAAFEKYIQGIPEYSVKIGNKWFSYDWAQPIGAVPAIIADLEESKKEGDGKIDAILGAFMAGGEVLFNQSFMSSLQALFASDNPAENLLNIALGEVTVPIPTLFSQVANVFDDKRRVTYDSTSERQSAINRAISKFPGLRNRLTPDVDIFGREVANSQQDWFNAFFNPANVYTDTSSEVSDHVYEIYKSTGDAGAIPAKAPYHSDLQGVKKKLNDSERADYQRAMGATASEMIEALLENDVYLAMNDEYKLAVLKTVYSYAATVAKSELDWYNSYEVIHGISKHVTKSDFESMSEEECIKIVDDYLFSDYNGMYNIETDEGKANYFVNQKTPGAVLSATMNGDIDAAKKLLNGIDERVKSYGWDKVDTEAEIKERKSTVRRTLTTYWKAAYINAYYKKNDAEKEKIRKTLIAIGLYGDSSDVRKTLREWIEAYEEEN